MRSEAVAAGLRARHAVVTGAGSGIGADTARALAASGASVTLMARKVPPLAELALELSSAYPGQSFHAIGADVTDAGSVADGFAAARDVLGPPSILVNNAGSARSGALRTMTPETWDATLAVNLRGVFLCTREVLQGMLDANYGRIVNVASTAGLRGYAYVGAYCAAKHGVIGLTRALIEETRDRDIRAWSVCPGFVDTPMTREAAAATGARTGRSASEILDEYAGMNASGALIASEGVAARIVALCLDEEIAESDIVVIE